MHKHILSVLVFLFFSLQVFGMNNDCLGIVSLGFDLQTIGRSRQVSIEWNKIDIDTILSNQNAFLSRYLLSDKNTGDKVLMYYAKKQSELSMLVHGWEKYGKNISLPSLEGDKILPSLCCQVNNTVKIFEDIYKHHATERNNTVCYGLGIDDHSLEFTSASPELWHKLSFYSGEFIPQESIETAYANLLGYIQREERTIVKKILAKHNQFQGFKSKQGYDRLLQQLCKLGDCDIIYDFLSVEGRGIDWMSWGFSSSRAFAFACQYNHIGLVKFLVGKGAKICPGDVMSTDSKISEDLVVFLIDQCEDITISDKEGNSFLHHVSRIGLIRPIQRLLDKGLDINIRNKNNETPLAYAYIYGKKMEVIKFLLDNGADPNSRRRNRCNGSIDWPVLSLACNAGDIELVQCLINKGSKINDLCIDHSCIPGLNNCPKTPLYYALLHDSHNKELGERAKKIIALLMDHGADINLVRKHFLLGTYFDDTAKNMVKGLDYICSVYPEKDFVKGFRIFNGPRILNGLGICVLSAVFIYFLAKRFDSENNVYS